MKRVKILLITAILILIGMFFNHTNAVSSVDGTIQLKAQLERPFKSNSEIKYCK